MDALSWFAGGNFILGGMVLDNNTILDFGVTIARTALNMYLRSWSQLGGEFVWWTKDCDLDWGEGGLCDASNTWRWSTTEYNLRPEVLETWYYAYIATKDEVWQDVAWQTFEAIEKVCKTDSGYSAISDMTKIDGGEKLDKMESFFFSEVVKYLYLMHIDVSLFTSCIFITSAEVDEANNCNSLISHTRCRTLEPARRINGSSIPKVIHSELLLIRVIEVSMKGSHLTCNFLQCIVDRHEQGQNYTKYNNA